MTTLYIVCYKHMERTKVVIPNDSYWGIHIEDPERHRLNPFMMSHVGCQVMIVTEHDNDAKDKRFVDRTDSKPPTMPVSYRGA